jgi:meiotically up-regulated gene 157 (Mug157) protein
VARGHLEWVFTKAERPNGFWQRSCLVNSKPKDRTVFQLDQQCYPLLKLCDYLNHFPEHAKFVRDIVDTGVIQDILSVLNSKKNVHTGLWPTEETPGDDAVTFPHHFSSHVLLWRTFTRLHRLFARLNVLEDLQSLQLDVVAAELRTRTIESFSATRPECGTAMFAYLTDGHGKYTFYHDANNVPTLFPQDWDFIDSKRASHLDQHDALRLIACQ